jgi:hypothetical protein
MAVQSADLTRYSAGPGALEEASERIATLCEQVVCWGPTAAPGALRELHEAITKALGVDPATTSPGCRHACSEQGLHCPMAEPPERMIADLQGRGWVTDWDPVEARVAHDEMCLCGTRMYYAALRPSDGANALAWAICPACRHWRQL